MDNYRYLILLNNNREAIRDWFLWREGEDKLKAANGEMCAILMDNGVVVSTVDELWIPKSQHWVVVAYVKGKSRTKLANKLNGQKYRIFFHGGGVDVGGGIEAIKQSFEENYGGCGFTEEYMYFSSGSNFPANRHIEEVKNIFSNEASK